MFYTVYKITNLVNGKIYVGVHKTDDLNDDYMGSGKYLKRAQEKYGIENFTREYLHVFDNAEDMFEMESELVNEEFVARDDTYNLKVGGFGGFDYINSDWYSIHEESRDRMMKGALNASAALKELHQNEEWKQSFNKSVSIGLQRYFSTVDLSGENAPFYGKTHSDQTKALLSEKAKLRVGEKNSSFGTMWITNLETHESKKIKKDDQIPSGWRKGRKIIKRT